MNSLFGKVYLVKNQAQSEALQRAVLAAGGVWATDETSVVSLPHCYIFVYWGGVMTTEDPTKTAYVKSHCLPLSPLPPSLLEDNI